MILNLLKAIGVSLLILVIIWGTNKVLIITEVKSVDYIEIPFWSYLIFALIAFGVFQMHKNSSRN